jgi:hypothetical protein
MDGSAVATLVENKDLPVDQKFRAVIETKWSPKNKKETIFIFVYS